MAFGKKKQGGGKQTTIFYATDLHGSTICFKKFINAAVYYTNKGRPIDVVIMGGDVAGKLIVPIIRENGHYKSYLTGMDYDMTTDDELAAFHKSCDTLGVYPCTFEPDEYQAFAGDKARQDALFHEVVLARLREWVEFAEARLEGQPFSCYLNPGNDDFFEVDEILKGSGKLIMPEGRCLRIDDDHEMISSGLRQHHAVQLPARPPRGTPAREARGDGGAGRGHVALRVQLPRASVRLGHRRRPRARRPAAAADRPAGRRHRAGRLHGRAPDDREVPAAARRCTATSTRAAGRRASGARSASTRGASTPRASSAASSSPSRATRS